MAHPDFVFSKLEQTIVHDANRDEIVSRFGTGEEEWEEEEEEVGFEKRRSEWKKGERSGGCVEWTRVGICFEQRLKDIL